MDIIVKAMDDSERNGVERMREAAQTTAYAELVAVCDRALVGDLAATEVLRRRTAVWLAEAAANRSAAPDGLLLVVPPSEEPLVVAGRYAYPVGRDAHGTDMCLRDPVQYACPGSAHVHCSGCCGVIELSEMREVS